MDCHRSPSRDEADENELYHFFSIYDDIIHSICAEIARVVYYVSPRKWSLIN